MAGKIVQQLHLTKNQLKASQLGQLSELFNWLEKCEQETVSMREIKLAFPNWNEVDTELDFYVQKRLIGRQDRRYQRLIPIITEPQLVQIIEQVKKIAATMVETKDWLKTSLRDEPWLVSLAIYRMSQQSNDQSIYFLPEIGYDCRQLSCQISDNYLFIDHFVEKGTKQVKGLANYFSNRSFNESNQAVYQIIGDVNPVFFLEMTGKQLELLADKQRPRQTKESIFLKVLAILGYVKKQGDDYQLTDELTVISQKDLMIKELEIQERLTLLIEESIKQQTEQKEKQFVETILLNDLLSRTKSREVLVFT